MIERRGGRGVRAKGFDRAAYDRAARDQELDRHLSSQPIPARITLALDYRGLFGDQVDRDLGVWEPPDGWAGPEWEPGTAVDRWEAGTLVPTRGQILALAELTGVPWRFFYSPVDHLPSRIFVCDRTKRNGRGLTIIRSEVDANGVLHNFYETDQDEPDQDEPEPEAPGPKPARRSRPVRPRKGRKQLPVETHQFEKDSYDPLACRVCGLPERNRRHDDGQGGSDG